MNRLVVLGSSLLAIAACSTTFVEFKGECVIQDWSFLGYTIRQRQICDLPPPSMFEEQVRDREPMDVNPYPNLFDLGNPADSLDPNLLEKKLEVPQGEAPSN